MLQNAMAEDGEICLICNLVKMDFGMNLEVGYVVFPEREGALTIVPVVPKIARRPANIFEKNLSCRLMICIFVGLL